MRKMACVERKPTRYHPHLKKNHTLTSVTSYTYDTAAPCSLLISCFVNILTLVIIQPWTILLSFINSCDNASSIQDRLVQEMGVLEDSRCENFKWLVVGYAVEKVPIDWDF